MLDYGDSPEDLELEPGEAVLVQVRKRPPPSWIVLTDRRLIVTPGFISSVWTGSVPMNELLRLSYSGKFTQCKECKSPEVHLWIRDPDAKEETEETDLPWKKEQRVAERGERRLYFVLQNETENLAQFRLLCVRLRDMAPGVAFEIKHLHEDVSV